MDKTLWYTFWATLYFGNNARSLVVRRASEYSGVQCMLF